MHRFLAVFIALAFVAAGGAGLVRAQDDADVSPAGQPPLGAAVPFINEEGTEVATVTVTAYGDPFEDYEEFSAPERGYRFVEVGLTVENTGRRPFPFSPYSIYLQDTEGFLYAQTFVSRTTELTEERPDYTGEDVPGGESLSGFIYFSVFSDAEIARIVYTDGFERLIFLADLTVEPLIEPNASPEAGTDAGADAEGGVDTEDGTETEDDAGDTETEDGEDVAALDLSEEECADVTAWAEESRTRFESLELGFEVLVSDDEPDPAALRDVADELNDVADEQAEADVPDVAQEANDAVVALLTGFADAIDEYADAIEAGDVDEETLNAIFADIEPLVAEGEALLAPLEEACGFDFE